MGISLLGTFLENEMKMQSSFVYPEAVKEGRLFAEDIEEAIIQYLVKGGFSEDKLRTAWFSFDHPDAGKEVTTQVLTIRVHDTIKLV
ncbi:MAG: hypothetical protein EHM49_00625 [Deltaproteobacteria bacterium]|nr:MAG: hypothetical protein EHM49_00625 [Deltaproteobacteria bacterium]